MTDHPHIVLILTDQHRYDFAGFMGHSSLRTPHLDELARGGTVFEQAYCPSPVCGPARASLFTGRYPPRHGAMRNWAPVGEDCSLLTGRLHESGYHNALVGKLHLNPAGDEHGFDWRRLGESPNGVYNQDEIIYNDYLRFLEQARYPDDPAQVLKEAEQSERLPVLDHRFWLGFNWVDDAHHMNTWAGEEVVRFVKHWDGDRPLFLNVSFYGPHHPYRTAEPWDSMYDPARVRFDETWGKPKHSPVFHAAKGRWQQEMAQWDERTWRRMVAYYCGQVSQIDHQIGRLTQALKQRGMWENSWVIFAADHGDHMGDFGLLGKGDMYESSARIPLIIKPPGTETGRRCPRVVNLLDVYGTILDIAGDSDWREDPAVEARSLATLAHQEDGQWKDRTFSWIGGTPAGAQTMLREGPHKIIRQGREDQPPLYELYDLAHRPVEMHDLYKNSAHARTRESLQRDLDAWTDAMSRDASS